MAEQTFRSPGFFEREIDASQRQTEIVGVPAGIVGTAEKGPAFVPVTVGSTADFVNKFGEVDPERFGPYAVEAFLSNRTALTYVRVLGAGSNETATDIQSTKDKGTVVNAGFKIEPDVPRPTAISSSDSSVQFLVARHHVSSSTDYSYPIFNDNPSFDMVDANSGRGADKADLVRAVLLTASGSRIQVLDIGEEWNDNLDQAAALEQTAGHAARFCFGLAISSSAGASFTSKYATQAGYATSTGNGDGVRIITASLNPTHQSYIANVLNTDPLKFAAEKHLLYIDFAVEDELASVDYLDQGAVCMLSGSSNSVTSQLAGDAAKALNVFGRFDTRYQTPRSPAVISQPYGSQEHNLFHFEALSDGAYANDKVKMTIANIKASTNANYPYPSFEIQVRRFSDSDLDQQVLESYPGCVLDPDSENFVGKKVGDYKARYNFDASNASEKRIIVTGRYPNVSNYIRVVISDDVYNKTLPENVCPFGFRGIPVLKTSDAMTDRLHSGLSVNNVEYGVSTAAANQPQGQRLWGASKSATAPGYTITGSIVPPLPLRYKVTRGQMADGWFSGWPSENEIVDARLNWGVKYERSPETGSLANANLDVNASSVANPIIGAYAKFQGISQIGAILTGSGADAYCANKFTLAKVALAGAADDHLLKYLTGSAPEHMKEAAYIRNANPDSKDYTVLDPDIANYPRVTLASLVQSSSVKFNRFTSYTAFNIPMYGGFDGLNILDKDMFYMNDRASSTDDTSSVGGMVGKAADAFVAGRIGLRTNPAGTGRKNNNIASYKEATTIITDPMATSINILAVPGIRDAFVTDHAAEKTKDYSMAIYLMDLPSWSEDQARLFLTEDRSSFASASIAFPDVRETTEQFESRAFDNNYTAAYFPDVYITDSKLGSKVRVPASIAAVSALAYNDSVAYPWFAPAGFNRGGLDIVSNTDVRLTAGDRDTLYDARVNPIANFADGSFVIFGQKTCQLAQSALDRVNVRRMLLELKRQVVTVADRLLFEPNNNATRARFINSVTPLLATIQSQQGIESFKVVMDDTNNSVEDVENNRLNGRLVVVPTRAIEFIAIDFVITNSGVDFQ